ncbi:MAG TPA: hypothetical protein VKA47_05480 [Solirubrobacterales bacterium]|nr:hypothetical protein [Solirubrobacterales bacterium]
MRINIEIDGEGQPPRSATAEPSAGAQTGPAPSVLGAAETAAGATDAGPAPTSPPASGAPPTTIASTAPAALQGAPGDIDAGGPAVPGMEEEPPSVVVEEEEDA